MTTATDLAVIFTLLNPMAESINWRYSQSQRSVNDSKTCNIFLSLRNLQIVLERPFPLFLYSALFFYQGKIGMHKNSNPIRSDQPNSITTQTDKKQSGGEQRSFAP